MKTALKLLVLVLCLGVVAGCNTNAKKKEKYNRKIYLTEEDYMEDLSSEAVKERRETKPLTESEYIFNVGPEEQKEVYFFDDRQQPKIPGQPSDADHRKEKRLWQKPKRYTPEEYYGMQGDAPAEDSSSGYDY